MIACPVCAAENPDGLRLCAQCGTALAIPGQPTPATPATRRRSAPTVVLPPDLPARLLVSTPEWSREFTLAKDTVTVGREADNDIVIEAEAVSRHHAIIKRRGPAFLIMDVGSTNGLNVDGKRVEEMLLASGDCVCVGHSVTLEYRGPETLATDTAAAALAGPLPGGQVAGAARATVTPEAPVYEVREGHSLILGRGDETGVHMAHPQVSERHAEVRRKADQYVIRDLGSSTGTYVNGQLVSQQVLRENDVIRVGPNRLVFQGGRLRLVIDEGGLRLDACHLGRVVGKGQRILQDVSLSIKPQEFVAVVGGSRTGKSTLIKALTGFEPATEGAVLLNGVDLYGNFDAYRNEMGHVPQDDVTPLDLPVSRALVYAARLRMPADTTRQEREQRVNEVIDELELRGCADRAIRRLSGGQRKRVSIGVELLTRPSLFFLDEVTSGLDPATEVQMMNLLRRLADQGRTIILTTRATKNVMACDKMAVLVRGGRLAYFGPPKEALDYFGVEEFDEIHAKLESQASPEDWAQRFLSSTIRDRLPVAHLSDRSRVLATVLFTDIVGSTQTAVELGDSAWRRLLDRHNDHVRRELKRFGGKVVNSAGDGFLATFDSPARAVKCAQAVCAAVKPLGLDVRVGCHTGEIELLGADVGGIAVHIGARVVALAGPCEVLASSTVKDLAAGSGLVFEDRGEHELKGVPGRWRLYAVGH